MVWCVAYREEDGEISFITDQTEAMGHGDRHVLPAVEMGDNLFFGAHDFTRQCYCSPEIETNHDGVAIITHRDMRPS